ncbi:MAG: formylglycine-generating enzyme family protein [Spirochaetia bacterium]|nr:formylglycine-generating enzyme family protein [Spirochaetia bacterium]
MKKILQCIFMVIFSVTGLRAQSYTEYLSKAKQYEGQKKWCYALGAYYDAMGTDESPESKKEAYEGYKALKDAILSGNPGLGKYNQFSIHDEWTNLLIDAEKYGSSNNMYEITVGKLEQGDLDYSAKTATYNAAISYSHNSRYKNTITIIERGYKVAYKEDWKDLPKDWPLYSASSKQNNVYNVDGALVYARVAGHYYKEHTCYLNAFEMFNNNIWTYETPGLYDYKFNIIDENGKEIVKGKRWLLAESKQISFSGVTPEVMDLIDNEKAYVNPIACYLEYGKYNSVDDNGGRTFIKKFPEVQLPLKREDFICGKNVENKIAKNVSQTKINNIEYFRMIPINNIEVMMTEVTQEMWDAIMSFYPDNFLGTELPVSNISWFEAIEFCNKLSELQGYIPVYSISNTETVTQNPDANGYRLPTGQEWLLASGARDSGINSSDIGWFKSNSENKTHPVAQKKANEYGLFDMNGNVREWCWDDYNEIPNNPGKITKGGSFKGEYMEKGIFYDGEIQRSHEKDIGFRIIRRISKE